MSNSRPFRRRIAGVRTGRIKTRARYPWGPPSLSTVRRHLRQLEAEGIVEQDVERTGKPGRPAHVWRITEKGRHQHHWTAPELTELLADAVNQRRFKDVPYLLQLLYAEDRTQAKRVERSLIRHGYRARDLPRGRKLPPWKPRPPARVA